MGVRAIIVAAALVLFMAPLGRADTIQPSSVGSTTSTPAALEFTVSGLDPYLQPQLLTIDANGSPSTSPELNVTLNALSLPEPSPAAFGIGRALLVLALALGTFVAVKVTATLLQRRWEHGRIAHL